MTKCPEKYYLFTRKGNPKIIRENQTWAEEIS